MSDNFKVTYSNDDGYAGGDRPHRFSIDADELNEGMSETEIKSLFWESIEGDFKDNHLNLYSKQEDDFLAWAKDVTAKLKESGA